LIDIPIPTEETGVFDRLGKMTAPGHQSASLAADLRKYAIRAYGVAGKEFIKALVAETGSDKRALRKRLERWIERFINKAGVNRDDTYEVRFAKRFALAYAAGRVAIEYRVVPWRQSLVLRCIGRVYRRTVRQRDSAVDGTITGAAARLVAQLPQIAKRAPDVTGRKKSIVSDPPILRVSAPGGGTMLAIKPGHLTQLVGGKVSKKALAAHLEQMGTLIPGAAGHRTRQVAVPGSKSRHRYYCLRLQANSRNRSDRSE